MERPKVVYNEKTQKYVLWFHLELKGQGYKAARVAMAVSDSPTGTFEYVRSYRPNAGIYPLNFTDEQKNSPLTVQNTPKAWSVEWLAAVENGLFVRRDLAGGQMSRDMTILWTTIKKRIIFLLPKKTKHCTLPNWPTIIKVIMGAMCVYWQVSTMKHQLFLRKTENIF